MLLQSLIRFFFSLRNNDKTLAELPDERLKDMGLYRYKGRICAIDASSRASL